MTVILWRRWDPQPVTLSQLSYEIGILFREEELGVNWVSLDIVTEERGRRKKTTIESQKNFLNQALFTITLSGKTWWLIGI